ncbi:MAG: hypothetical protein J6T48_06300 [Bacteroidales bacterium]|nr:hypothetical protein [Bacteroidales bacterium]
MVVIFYNHKIFSSLPYFGKLAPDVIPIYGWIDDGLILAISIINLVQSYLKERHEALANKFRRTKLVMVQIGFFAIVAIAIIVLCTKIFA